MLNWIPNFENLDSFYDLIGITYLPLTIGIFYLFIRINTTKKYLIALIWSPFLLAQIAQLSILHYESRYFINVRFLVLGLFVNLLLLRSLERNNLLKDSQQLAPFVHKNAICDSNNIGHGTRIWAFSHVLKDAQIGTDCNICENVYIENLAVVGNRVTIKNGVQIWDQVLVEDDVFIGPNVTFTNDKFPRSKKYPAEYLRTVVQKGASIGANATILPGIVIGKGSMVGAGSVVTKDVPNYTLVIGNPARIIRKISNLEE
jgi:acetyltransferase-like isoleucine patch superfamily enzyme